MAGKNLIAKKLSFFDGNVKFDTIYLDAPMEAWRILIEVEVSQKDKSPFKMKAKLLNEIAVTVAQDTFEFDNRNAKRTIIFGNPFEMNAELINCIDFEYFDYAENSLVYFWLYVYEVDEGTREDLFPFSTTK